MSEPINMALAGDPGSGKTTLALFPYEPIAGATAKVLLIATNPVAYRLKGIPKAWIKDRVTVELVGFEQDAAGVYGKRKSAGEYYKACVAYASKPKDGYSLIVVDDLTSMARARYNDALESMGGVPSEYRRELEAPQSFVQYFMERLWSSNKDATILTLHHVKRLYASGADRKFVGYGFELVGKALDDTWPGKFDSFFFLRTIEDKDPSNPKVLKETRKLELRKGPQWDFVISRSGLGVPEFPATVNIDCTSEQNTQPLADAWKAMIQAVGGD